MPISEKHHVSALVKALKRVPGSVVFKHADRVTTGIPDISFTRKSHTLWIEAKLVKNRGVISKGIQDLTMERLSLSGRAVYVIWNDIDAFICQPINLSSYHTNFLHHVSAMRYDAIAEMLTEIIS